MDWQQLAALLIVGATVLAFAWRCLGLRGRAAGCQSFCGCASAGRMSTPQSLILYARKGERPRIVVRRE